MSKVILCDVDGVVADLMGGFSTWLQHNGHPACDPAKVELFDIRKSSRLPTLVELDDCLRGTWSEPGSDGGINGAFMEYMRRSDTYDWVEVIEGASDGIKALQEVFDVRFCTALMEAAPDHVPSKMRWLKNNFPDVPYYTAPAKLKMGIKGDLGIDDRYDTCARWEEVGTKAYLFRQSWNEAPVGTRSYDWSNLVGELLNDNPNH